jgi:hypothetical protein
VTDIDAAVRFLMTALPDFRVRHDSGPGPDRFVHVGTDENCIAAGATGGTVGESGYGAHPGANHVGSSCRTPAPGARGCCPPVTGRAPARISTSTGSGSVSSSTTAWGYEFVEYHSADPAMRNEVPA